MSTAAESASAASKYDVNPAHHYRYNSIVNVGRSTAQSRTARSYSQAPCTQRRPANDDQMTIQLTPEGRQDGTPAGRTTNDTADAENKLQQATARPYAASGSVFQATAYVCIVYHWSLRVGVTHTHIKHQQTVNEILQL